MSALIVRFPTRRRKAFRKDWLEMRGLPHNCYEFKGRWMNLYRSGKERQFDYRAQLAALGPDADDFERESLVNVIKTRDRALEKYFDFTGGTA